MHTDTPPQPVSPAHVPARRRRSTVSGLVACFLFMALGVAMLRGSYHKITEWQAARHWPSAPAKILALSMQYVPTHGEDDASKMAYRIQARYTYQFEGNNHESTRVALIDEASSNPAILVTYRDLDKHRAEGRPVACYVNPANPSEAVLDRHLQLGSLGLWSFYGAVLLLLGFGGMVFHGYKLVRRKSNTSSRNPGPHDA